MFAVDKPKGLTSHDVVAEVRRVLAGARVGHAGTLDPDATGVLVLCVGKATKISSFLMEGRKEYEGIGRLGQATDTQDGSGRVLEERPVEIAPEDVPAAARAFVGRIEQIPPMFSAVKVDGKKLYRLARQGVEVERPARTVTVHAFEILRVDLPDFEFVLRCSKGTYVRTLVHDLGARLGCGGHLAALTRSRQGTFDRGAAVPWDVLRSDGAAEAIRARWVTPSEALSFLPTRRVGTSGAPLRAGVVLAAEMGDTGPGDLVRLAVCPGGVRGVGKVQQGGIRVLHLFPAEGPFGRGKRAP